ncbi:phage protein NinX family protein [Morganella morganii]|uniref:phage protein NinX family protein n=1 Tax=Morganella morganii TaxID=582 RepID=UPI003EBCCDF4
MNKYRDKSDFEVNRAVAERYLTREYRINSTDKSIDLIDISLFREYGGEINLTDRHVTGNFDPCNNPYDAIPVIIENKICMAYDVFSEDRDGGNWVAKPAYGFSNERVRSNNYYRAAMELFLMMKDAENEKG